MKRSQSSVILVDHKRQKQHELKFHTASLRLFFQASDKLRPTHYIRPSCIATLFIVSLWRSLLFFSLIEVNDWRFVAFLRQINIKFVWRLLDAHMQGQIAMACEQSY